MAGKVKDDNKRHCPQYIRIIQKLKLENGKKINEKIGKLRYLIWNREIDEETDFLRKVDIITSLL